MKSRGKNQGRHIALLLPLLLVLSTGPAEAEQASGSLGEFAAGANFNMLFPVMEFADTVDTFGFGFDVDLYYVFRKVDIAAGAGLIVSWYGSTETQLDYDLDVVSENMIFVPRVFVRYQPKFGIFEPYVEAFVGGTILTVETHLEEDWEGESSQNRTEERDGAFSYGGGLGFLVRVSSMPGTVGGKTKAGGIFLDGRVLYVGGGETGYYTNDAIIHTENHVVFDENKRARSRTDMVSAHLGLVLKF